MRTLRAVWMVALISSTALAADHKDSPAVTAEPAADLADLYAWTAPEGGKVNLLLTFHPDAAQGTQFSDAVLYVFHVSSKQSFDAAQSEEMRIVCGFGADQELSCWAGEEFARGAPGGTEGISSESGRLRVFAGLRNDPFFFNLDGFQAVAKTVIDAAPALEFDEAGCPALDAETSEALVTQLARDPDGSAATDDFAEMNVQVIAVQVDEALITRGGPIVGIWASTHQRQ